MSESQFVLIIIKNLLIKWEQCQKIQLPPNTEVTDWNSFHVNDIINTPELLVYLHTCGRTEGMREICWSLMNIDDITGA